MFLFKASGATYRAVTKQRIHAFPHSPVEVNEDELVLLSKNREDCNLLEKQVQFVARLHRIRPATDAELERLFPGVSASKRWKYVVQLYCLQPLTVPFNLDQVKGLNAKRYRTVQGFARLDSGDDLALVRHLATTNEAVVLDIMNAEPPSDGGDEGHD